MTSVEVVTSKTLVTPLWLAATSKANSQGTSAPKNAVDAASQPHTEASDAPSICSFGDASLNEGSDSQNIQLIPFRDRLALRRQRYVPLGDRSPWQPLEPLFAGGQLKQVAAGHWPPEQNEQIETGKALEIPEQSVHEQWILARLTDLEPSSGKVKTPPSSPEHNIQLAPYLLIGMTSAGDLSLRLLPTCHQRGAEFALSTLDGVGREFKIVAQASFIQRLAQLQDMQLELCQEFAIRRSLYKTLAQTPLRPSQALRYFDRLLDESPYPPSRTPASDRLLQRRQLLQAFSTNPDPTLWDAYGAVAHWVNYAAPGNANQRWQSCCQGAGAKMLRQGLAYAVALQYDRQDAVEDSQRPRQSGAQRSLEASDALQARIQELRSS